MAETVTENVVVASAVKEDVNSQVRNAKLKALVTEEEPGSRFRGHEKCSYSI